MLLHNPPAEGQDGCGIVWYSVVRLACEVELSHLQSTFSAACQLWGGGIYYMSTYWYTSPVLASYVWYSLPVSAGQ